MSYGLRGLNGQVYGLGDPLSDYYAYEASLAQAQQAAAGGGQFVQPPLPASMQAGTYPVPTSDCTIDSCVGPYSNPAYNYDAWLNRTVLPNDQAKYSAIPGVPAGSPGSKPAPIPVGLINKVVAANRDVWGAPLNSGGSSVLVQTAAQQAAASKAASQSTASQPPAGGSAPGSPLLSPTLQPAASGFSLASLPWWAWVGAAGAGLWVMKGGR